MTPGCLFLYLDSTICAPDLSNLTSCIDALHVWFFVNGMALNAVKSEAILLGTSLRAHSYSNLVTVYVACSEIPLAVHVKILAVTLDKTYTWTTGQPRQCQ